MKLIRQYILEKRRSPDRFSFYLTAQCTRDRLSPPCYTSRGSASHGDEALRKAHAGPPAAGHVHAKLRVAPCASADLRTFFNPNPSPQQLQQWREREQQGERLSSTAGKMGGAEIEDFSSYRLMGGTGGLWEVTAIGAGVSSLRPGDLAIPSTPTTIPNTTGTRPSIPSPAIEGTGARRGYELGIPVPDDVSAHSETSGATIHRSESSESGDENASTWRLTTTLSESSLLQVPDSAVATVAGTGLAPEVLAHVSTSVATAIRLLEDFAPSPGGRLEKGDRIVVTGAFSAVAQVW